MSAVSTLAGSSDLALLEGIIERGQQTFVEVGVALMRIHQGGLYKSNYATWESYCKERWGWSRVRAHQLMQASNIVLTAVNDGYDVPTERHARELARVPAEERPLVMADATHAAGGQPTATQLRDQVERRIDGKAKSPGEQAMRTPDPFYSLLNRTFGPFVLDAYASPHNAKCDRFYTIEQDGNVQPWCDVTFGNPHFKKGERSGMELCLAKAVEEQNRGIRSCIVGPVGCSQDWFHEYAIQGTVFAPDTRINFLMPDGTPTTNADRDTHVYLFGKGWKNQNAAKGEFRLRQLKVAHLAPEGDLT